MEFVDVEGEEDDEYDEEEDESVLLEHNLLVKSDNAYNDKMQYDSDNEMQQITSLGSDSAEMVQFDLALCGDQENSEIIDENYDPSEFLLQGRYGFQQSKDDGAEDNVSNDLVVSDSDEESNRTSGQLEQENEELWF
ncbi:hypothetical protein AVEN_207637-1 [Araneus ventricosus]|uniref:Uncharacterized protein n=1 Tax=Araneus ventricosus TaxID=182803 RepID=A0A4Y2L7Q9_ARAVE|nr:hypothetical protein AVEN_207637-1 [Araneus ventricosus]